MTHALPLHPPVCSGGTAQTRSAVPVPEPPRAVHTVSSKYIGGRDEDRRETETRESACLPVLVGAERVQIRSYRTGEQQRILTPSAATTTTTTTKRKKSRQSWGAVAGNPTWGITAIFDRRSASPMVLMSTPSMKIAPEAGSTNRRSARNRVDFPAPVRPQMPTCTRLDLQKDTAQTYTRSDRCREPRSPVEEQVQQIVEPFRAALGAKRSR